MSRSNEIGYLITEIDTPIDKTDYLINLQYYEYIVPDETCSRNAPDFSQRFLNCPQKWHHFYGLLTTKELKIDPWNFERENLDGNDDEELFRLKIASLTSFLPCWTVQIETEENFLCKIYTYMLCNDLLFIYCFHFLSFFLPSSISLFFPLLKFLML